MLAAIYLHGDERWQTGFFNERWVLIC